MDELRMLIQQYDPFYEMTDDTRFWQRGQDTDRRIRVLVKRLRAEGYGAEVDELLGEHPNLVGCPNGVHVLA
jgi:hypothetical protein